MQGARTHMAESPAELFSACAWALITTVVAVSTILILRRKSRHGKLLRPPGPPGLPIIGHLHILQPPLHHTLHKLSQKYGAVFWLTLGNIPTLVISSPHWAKQIFHLHDRDFADRAHLEVSKRIFYNCRTMIMMDYGPIWRDLRKLYTLQILSAKRVQMFEKVRQEEMAIAMKLIHSHALTKGDTAIDIKELLFCTVGNMTSRMLFSKRSFDPVQALDAKETSSFKQMVEELSVLFGTPVVSDFIPWLGWFDNKGCKKRMDSLAKRLDAFFEGVVQERIEMKERSKEEAESDYLDLLLRIYREDGKVDKESIKCILLDLLPAATETTTTTLQWLMAELLRNPDCMKKLQEELDTLVLITGEPTSASTTLIHGDAKLAKLNYLQAVISETLRLHPPFPIVMHQMCKGLENGVQVENYHLPKNTRVILNLRSLGQDPAFWGDDAETFCPDRFLRSADAAAPNFQGQHFEFLPFGAGRRGCPGMHLATTVLASMAANLVHGIDWKIPDGMPLDLTENIAFSVTIAEPLLAIPNLRQGWPINKQSDTSPINS